MLAPFAYDTRATQGEASGLYGAKITGGGSGGTVCVLGEATEAAQVPLAWCRPFFLRG